MVQRRDGRHAHESGYNPEISDMAAFFVIGAGGFVMLWVAGMRALQIYRQRRDPGTKREGDGFRAGCSQDGWFTVQEWGDWPRGFIFLSVFLLLILPTMIFLSAFLMGGILAASEAWTFDDGFDYVLGNMVGVGPIVNLVPATHFGIALDVIVSLYTLLLTNGFLGMTACLSLSVKVTDMIPDGICGLSRVLLIYAPVTLVALAVVFGGIIAKIEDWSFGDGILFMIGSLCTIEDPLVKSHPTTSEGIFFNALCYCVELSISGILLGIIGAHPVVGAFLFKCEGVGLHRLEGTTATDQDGKVGSTDETAETTDGEVASNDAGPAQVAKLAQTSSVTVGNSNVML
jgi:hypothetical protein